MASTSKRKRWQPLHTKDHPIAPKVDHKYEEEMAAQAIAQAAGFEGRRQRKFLQRRTVDYSSGLTKWNEVSEDAQWLKKGLDLLQ